MSRKNKTFPQYVVLKIDPQSPPEDIWERGARRCIKCGTQWPNYAIFSPSPCCGGACGTVQSEPHMTWAEAVKSLLHARFERYYARWNDNVTDEELMWDESIEIPFDEEAFQQGMEEIERLIGESKSLEAK